MSRLERAIEEWLESARANPGVNPSHETYDNVVWAAVTADRSELNDAASHFVDHFDLPAPLIVLIQRLAGLEAVVAGDVEAAQVASANISCFCCPIEERNATRSLSGESR